MTPEYRERYSRQIRLTGVGEEGQQHLRQAHVLIVGCGALGSFQAAALARAGVGKLTIIDRDYVELSNLQRQWLFDESDAHDVLPKAVAAARHIAEINGECRVEGLVQDLTASNIEEVCAGVQLILDGTDNFETRYLINDYAVRESVPWIYGGAVGTYGITMPIVPGETACFACVYPDPPSGAQPTCETAGVLNVVTSLVASIQVADALKILCGHRSKLRYRITRADAWDGTMRQSEMPARQPECFACGARVFPYLSVRRPIPVSLCGRNAVQIHDRTRPLDLGALQKTLARVGEVRGNEFAVRVMIAPYEMTVFPDGRAIVKGTTDIGIARSLYSKYIGN